MYLAIFFSFFFWSGPTAQWPLSGKGGDEERTTAGTSASSGTPGERAGRSLHGDTPGQPCYKTTAGVTPALGGCRGLAQALAKAELGPIPRLSPNPWATFPVFSFLPYGYILVFILHAFIVST